MLRCPEAHEEAFLVLSTGEMVGRMVRSGLLGCPACQREYPIVQGVAHFSASGTGGELTPRPTNAVAAGAPPRSPDAQTLQALLELSRSEERRVGKDGKARWPQYVHREN